MVFALLRAITFGDQPDFLPPDVVALYEAGFGVLALNANLDELMTADGAMKRAINHETYHHLQTICTGYGWKRGRSIKSIVVQHINDSGKREKKDNGGLWRAVAFLNWLPARVQRAIDAPRITDVLMFAIRSNWRIRLEQQRDPDDPSLAAAEFPGLFKALDELRDDLWCPGADGVAAGHVMEGAAVAHDVLLTTLTLDGPDALNPLNAVEIDARIEQETAPLGAEYSTLLTAARGRCGGPAGLLLLPAAALALHYERPGSAFLPMIDRLRAVPPDTVADAARTLAAQLPAIPEAGEVLGSARQAAQRAEQARWFRWLPWRRGPAEVHADAFAALAAGPHDELAVLTDIAAFGTLGGAIISCALRCNDRVMGVEGITPADTAVRIMGMNLALRAQTRRSAERDIEQRMLEWTQKVLDRTFGGGRMDDSSARSSEATGPGAGQPPA